MDHPTSRTDRGREARARDIGRPRYPTWLRPARIVPFAAVAVASAIGLALTVVSPWFLLFALPLIPAAYVAVVLLWTARRLSPRGGDAQRRVHRLIIDTLGLGGDAEVLDVGCGSGQLAIALAAASPNARITGVDSWGPSWAYSLEQCEHNARAEGVVDRVRFERGSGSALPFATGSFDAIVSCMTFHEIRDADPRSRSVTEALRVLRPGGRFVFVDPFLDTAWYSSVDEVREAVAAAGAVTTRAEPLRDLLPLPFPLGHPKVLGRAMLLAGHMPRAR